MPMIPQSIGSPRHGMPVMPSAKIHGTPTVPPAGLSPDTQKLWLAAMRYRQLADLGAELLKR